MLAISIALTPAFKMKFWNIGAEGQTLMGALASVVVIWYFGGKIPDSLLIMLMFVLSVVFGAIWAVIPEIFKSLWNTNETLFTLMMNYIATQIVAFTINVWIKNGSGVVGMLDYGSFSAVLFNKQYLINVLLVTIVTILMFLYLRYSKHGYELTVVGESLNTAKYVGIKVKKVVIRTMILSGVICGFAGFILVGGTPAPTITPTLVGGRGFTGILIAWMGQLNPAIIAAYSLMVALLQRGATEAASAYGITGSSAYIGLLTGTLFLVVIAAEFFVNYKINFKHKNGAKIPQNCSEGGIK